MARSFIGLFGAFSGLSIFGADALSVLTDAVSKAGSTDHPRVRNGLEWLQADSPRLFDIQRSGWVRLT